MSNIAVTSQLPIFTCKVIASSFELTEKASSRLKFLSYLSHLRDVFGHLLVQCPFCPQFLQGRSGQYLHPCLNLPQVKQPVPWDPGPGLVFLGTRSLCRNAFTLIESLVGSPVPLFFWNLSLWRNVFTFAESFVISSVLLPSLSELEALTLITLSGPVSRFGLDPC